MIISPLFLFYPLCFSCVFLTFSNFFTFFSIVFFIFFTFFPIFSTFFPFSPIFSSDFLYLLVNSMLNFVAFGSSPHCQDPRAVYLRTAAPLPSFASRLVQGSFPSGLPGNFSLGIYPDMLNEWSFTMIEYDFIGMIMG